MSKFGKIAGVSGLAIAAFALSACDGEDQTSHAYQDLQSCLSADVYEDAICEAGFEQAQQEHAQYAPRYTSIEDCEEDYGVGQCEIGQNGNNTGAASNDGGSFFTPFLIGYMLGGGFDSSSSNHRYTPLYKSSTGSYRTLAGSTVASSAFNKAGTRVAPSSFKAPTAPKTYTAGQSYTKVQARQAAAAAKAKASKPKTSFKPSRSTGGFKSSSGFR